MSQPLSVDMNSAPDVILLTMEPKMSGHPFLSLLDARTESVTSPLSRWSTVAAPEVDKRPNELRPLVNEYRCPRDKTVAVGVSRMEVDFPYIPQVRGDEVARQAERFLIGGNPWQRSVLLTTRNGTER